MTDLGGLVRRVAERARALARELPPPLDAEELAAAEATLGVALPPLLARLYREVANGGFGPGYHLLPLVGPGRTVVGLYRAERTAAEGGTGRHWPVGVLPLMDWGCGMSAAVDCLAAGAPVLLFEPNGIVDNWADAWFVDAESLADWLETWFAGTGWYEQIAGADGPSGKPRPWAEAGARLRAPEPEPDRAP
ncbi:SMI1/KNR4 family protein [Kitasatospora indigofera]|uniref:SMI1/KNR4 family protein n=1 Tax=Kitasatospora indigofera TaxID=67307 RepID=UPI0036BC12D9